VSVVACIARGWVGAGWASLVVLAGCDPCTGLQESDKRTCCTDTPTAPSCGVDPEPEPSCGELATQSCALVADHAFGFLLDPSVPEFKTRYFSTTACTDCRALSVGIRLRDEAPSELPNLTVQVLSADLQPLVAFSGPLTGDGVLTRTFGARGDNLYIIRVTAESGVETNLNVTAVGTGEILDIEPNGTPDQAMPIDESMIVDGHEFAVSGDHAGVDSSLADPDWFGFSNSTSAGSLVVTAVGSVQSTLAGVTSLAVLDAMRRPILAERTLEAVSVRFQFGLAPSADYFVRVLTAPEQHYELAFRFSDELFETEPNDTGPNAQPLAADQVVFGGYSSSGELTDDDVFRIAVPIGSSLLSATIEVQAPPESAAETEAAVLGEDETQLAGAVVPANAGATLMAPLNGQSFAFIRLRSSSSFVDHTYRLQARFE
jgi:hypothetical protein